MTTLGNQISKNIIDAMNNEHLIIQGLIRRKEPKNALILLGLRPAKRMKSTAGESAKS